MISLEMKKKLIRRYIDMCTSRLDLDRIRVRIYNVEGGMTKDGKPFELWEYYDKKIDTLILRSLEAV